MKNPKLNFINHASVLISNKGIGLLSDPWYQGSAFNDGWKLIYENNDDEINSMLNNKVASIFGCHMNIQIIFLYLFLKNLRNNH